MSSDTHITGGEMRKSRGTTRLIIRRKKRQVQVQVGVKYSIELSIEK